MVVKVAPAVRGQYHADAAADTARCGGVAAVGHCDRILQGAAVQDLIPADDGLAVLLEEVANTLHEEGLELLDVLETEHLHKVLAVLALTIHILRGLVAADVVVRRREEFEQFREHILQELESAGSRSIEVLPDAPAGFHLIAALGEAAQLRISGNGGGAVAGDFHLRNHGHAPPAGILHDLADVVLGVESAVRNAVAYPAVERRLLAPGTDFGEARILVDLDAPSLVLGQMPVEHILLVHCHQVDELHHLLLGEEIAPGVEQEAAVGKFRLVFNLAAGSLPLDFLHGSVRENLGRKQLQEGLQSVESTRHVGSLNEHLGRTDAELVGFFAEPPDLAEHDSGAFAVEGESGRSLDRGGEILGDFFEFRRLDQQPARLANHKRTIGGS